MGGRDRRPPLPRDGVRARAAGSAQLPRGRAPEGPAPRGDRRAVGDRVLPRHGARGLARDPLPPRHQAGERADRGGRPRADLGLRDRRPRPSAGRPVRGRAARGGPRRRRSREDRGRHRVRHADPHVPGAVRGRGQLRRAERRLQLRRPAPPARDRASAFLPGPASAGNRSRRPLLARLPAAPPGGAAGPRRLTARPRRGALPAQAARRAVRVLQGAPRGPRSPLPAADRQAGAGPGRDGGVGRRPREPGTQPLEPRPPRGSPRVLRARPRAGAGREGHPQQQGQRAPPAGPHGGGARLPRPRARPRPRVRRRLVQQGPPLHGGGAARRGAPRLRAGARRERAERPRLDREGPRPRASRARDRGAPVPRPGDRDRPAGPDRLVQQGQRFLRVERRSGARLLRPRPRGRPPLRAGLGGQGRGAGGGRPPRRVSRLLRRGPPHRPGEPAAPLQQGQRPRRPRAVRRGARLLRRRDPAAGLPAGRLVQPRPRRAPARALRRGARLAPRVRDARVTRGPAPPGRRGARAEAGGGGPRAPAAEGRGPPGRGRVRDGGDPGESRAGGTPRGAGLASGRGSACRAHPAGGSRRADTSTRRRARRARATTRAAARHRGVLERARGRPPPRQALRRRGRGRGERPAPRPAERHRAQQPRHLPLRRRPRRGRGRPARARDPDEPRLRRRLVQQGGDRDPGRPQGGRPALLAGGRGTHARGALPPARGAGAGGPGRPRAPGKPAVPAQPPRLAGRRPPGHGREAVRRRARALRPRGRGPARDPRALGVEGERAARAGTGSTSRSPASTRRVRTAPPRPRSTMDAR